MMPHMQVAWGRIQNSSYRRLTMNRAIPRRHFCLHQKPLLHSLLALILMGVLCSAIPSHAEVVYKSIYVHMVNSGLYNFDFNNDGTVDLVFALNLNRTNCPYTITAVETP